MLPPLGYRRIVTEAGIVFRPKRAATQRPGESDRRPRSGGDHEAAEGPFAKLKQLRLAR
jgi:hypothetical protein